VATDQHDAGAGVEGDTFQPPSPGLDPGATTEFKVGLRFVDTLGLSPVTATRQTGDEHVVTAKLADVNGRPQARKKLGWTVAGANFASGSVTTDRKGQARIGWIGGQPGDDTLTVFQDANGDGNPDFTETQATATVTWQGPNAPISGSTVNVREQRGNVTIQLARGTSRGRAKALGLPPAAVDRFVPLRTARSIPVGSILNTKRGTVRLLSAGRRTRNNSAFNGGSFNGGIFRVQQRPGNALTTLTMMGSELRSCKTRVPSGGARKIVAARRRSRSLFGRGRGRFRTRGRYSSATVRGTQWLQKDSCNGTLTQVKQGTVVVRDFSKRRNVVLRAKGRKRYVARAPRHR
jgi:hypothetical protein